MVGLEGAWPTGFEAAWLKEYRPAGVILFSRNVQDFKQLRNLCDVLHQTVPGLEIMADHEGGPVSQLSGALGRPPAAWGLGVLDDPKLTADVFAETGRRLVAAGVDRVLAPVADVLVEARNPVIGARAFGAEASLVSRHTRAAVTGLRDSGIRVCLKHWPGHGGSGRDSHLGEAGLGDGAIPGPFSAGLDAGADGVMVGHLSGAGSSAGSSPPASLDPDFMSVTRTELAAGRSGPLQFFADDVTMGALGPAMSRLKVAVPEVLPSGLYDPGKLPMPWFEKLAEAGCDRFLIRGIPETAFPLTRKQGSPPERLRPTFSAEEGFQDRPYTTARDRLWAQAGDGFPDPGADLLWLDFARADRWEAAAGLIGSGWEAVRTRLAGMFRSIQTGADNFSLDRPCTRLLVSSHRPVVGLGEALENLAPHGVCLVLGHPSLENDLRDLLGDSWRIEALFDIAPEDLE